MPRWTRKDKERVRKALDRIVAKRFTDGGQAEFSRALGLASRAVVHNWWQRGIVPLAYHDAIISLAPDLKLTPAMLSPRARRMAQINSTLVTA
jgi:hypothetical protein